MLSSLENFTMDVAHTAPMISMDGYYSKNGLIIANYEMGCYKLSSNRAGGLIAYNSASLISTESAIWNA